MALFRFIPDWTLTVHPNLDFHSTLVRDFGSALRLVVELTPAFTGLLLALAVAQAIDQEDGVLHKVGFCKTKTLGRVLEHVPGNGNRVEDKTVGTNKRRLMRLIRAELAELVRQSGMPLQVDDLVANGGHGQGYHLTTSLGIHGVDLDDLVRNVRRAKVLRDRPGSGLGIGPSTGA